MTERLTDEALEKTGTISTTRFEAVRYRYGHDCGDTFGGGSDYDGLALTVECADVADARAMLDAITHRATPADDLRTLALTLLDDAITSMEEDMCADAEDAEATGERPDLALYEVALTYEMAKTIRAALSQPAPRNSDAPCCSDCPRAGYPTDKTRCDGCPLAALSQNGGAA